jgi:hypothetical protein
VRDTPTERVVHNSVSSYLRQCATADDPRQNDLFRNPMTAGRFYWTFFGERVLVAEYPGIITWPEHEQLVARLDSRAHRAGISPANTWLLTGMLTDHDGHPMYGKGPRKPGSTVSYYACRVSGCALHVPMTEVDEEVTAHVMDLYGPLPHKVRKVIAGSNYDDEIARKRLDIRELDPEAEDYDTRLATLRAELAHLRTLPSKPDVVEWMDTGQTIAQHWQTMTIPQRHDWLRDHGYKITVSTDPEFGWSLAIDAGWMAEIGADEQAESLGFSSPW